MIFDWPTRMQQMADFMGFSEEDLELVRASGADPVGPSR